MIETSSQNVSSHSHLTQSILQRTKQTTERSQFMNIVMDNLACMSQKEKLGKESSTSTRYSRDHCII
jgi:hypothetical protein